MEDEDLLSEFDLTLADDNPLHSREDHQMQKDDISAHADYLHGHD